MTPDDLIVHDEFVHNSAVVGMRLSGAKMRAFRHNNLEALEKILKEERANFRNALVVIEGLYSTEGDIPDLARPIARFQLVDFVLVRIERIVVREHGIAFHGAGNVGPHPLRIRVHRHDFLADGFGVV